jgi:hypothetical protein
MRIDSSGNVGIGTSSVAGGRVQISGATSDTDGLGLDQGQLLITDSDAAAANGMMLGYRFQAGITEYGRIQCRNAIGATNLILQAGGGNVGIGTSSPISGYKLTMEGNGAYAALRCVTSAGFSALSGFDGATQRWSVGQLGFGGNNGLGFYVGSSTEVGRFDASGNLLVGTTSTPSASQAGVRVGPSGFIEISQGSGTGSWDAMTFLNGNGGVGFIRTSGSSTSFLTSSDVRLKENIAAADDASSLIDAIQVRKFDWKADGEHQRYGFVAQELIEVAPEAVSQPEDPDAMMGVDYSKLVPMLIKEVQSLRARVAQLEGN